MKYYVYFDAYGHARQAISDKELAQTYQNDPDRFLEAICRCGPDNGVEHITGHKGTLSFQSEKGLTN